MERTLLDKGLFCTGCGACSASCPVSAIEMAHDDEGFIKARIDRDRCVGCGLCKKVCPVLNPDYSNDEPICHAMRAADDEILEASYSGGTFSLLAEDVLADGGVVFGAAWGEDLSVAHRKAEDLEGLCALRGSKYAQSDTRDTFAEVREALGAGRRVLFSGCPCHVAGLRACLAHARTDSSRLLAIDIVCHGVPSDRVFRAYLDDAYGEDAVEAISFRNKREFGWGGSEVARLRDGSVVRSSHSAYLDVFNPCLIMGKACGACPFSRLPRQGDVTLGDFWGIERHRPELKTARGLSVVLANNAKGTEALGRIVGRLDVCEELPLSYATEVNKTIVHPYPNHPGRKHFYSSFGMKPFGELAKASLEHRYDIGVVGLWYGINYGSVLTYYALYLVLRKLGYDAVMLPKPNGLWTPKFDDPQSMGQRFIWQRCNVFAPYPSQDEFALANDACGAFVVGSDVVWYWRVCGRDVGQFFFLDWVKNDHKRIAYASSFGIGLEGPEEYQRLAKINLSNFDHLSVRERAGADALAEMTGRDDVAHVADPVFLCGRDVFEALADEAPQADGPFVFAYLLRKVLKPLKARFISHAREAFGAGIRVTGNADRHDEARELIEDVLGSDEGFVEEMEVAEWLRAVRDCSFYVGDSYHGICFSLMFHVPFVAVYEPTDGAFERLRSLLGLVGLQERLVTEDIDDERIDAIIGSDIDWDRVDEALAAHADASLAWLKDALAAPAREMTDADRIHDAQIDERLRLAAQLREAREEAARARAEADGIRASRTFKAGQALTWLPRAVRSALRRG